MMILLDRLTSMNETCRPHRRMPPHPLSPALRHRQRARIITPSSVEQACPKVALHLLPPFLNRSQARAHSTICSHRVTLVGLVILDSLKPQGQIRSRGMLVQCLAPQEAPCGRLKAVSTSLLLRLLHCLRHIMNHPDPVILLSH